ncbi:MAG: BREX protein BrxB domain-containing protein [Thermoanaerobaculia bacterium]
MPSLTDDFNELVLRVQQGRELNYASFEPVYYLVFPPREIIAVKRELPAWTAKLTNLNFHPVTFSIAEAIDTILQNDPRRDLWTAMDRQKPLEWEKANQSLANALMPKLQQAIEDAILTATQNKNGIVIVTDLEALHPYLRIGAIEGKIQGRFSAPTVFLYPGTRVGKTSLSFLGFYPEDGNYRSVHIGRTF